MIPYPVYEIDVHMVQMLETRKLEDKISKLSIREVQPTSILDSINCLKNELKKHPREFHPSMLSTIPRIEKYDQGMIKPISLPFQRSKKGLEYTKKSKKKYAPDLPIKFAKGPICSH